jgi:lipopolysaccharide/colanic/teichoic acid biosynthesis glycosyltransferase
VVKRAFDFFLALAGLMLIWPVLLIVAVAIRLDSPGPSLFVQERVGRNGRLFRMHKFRTMRVNAEAAGPQVTAANDSRITRTGAFLRRYKLDELPQLFDVLIGKMSLVGPRPEVPRYVAAWPADARREILAVRPGITDPMALEYFDESALLAQASDPEHAYLHEVLPRKVQGYLRYVRSRSLALDVNVILRTILRAFHG